MPTIAERFDPPGPGAWEIEATHMNRPISRWLEDVFPAAFMEGFRAGTEHYGILLDHLEAAVVNRFVYMCPRPVGAPRDAKGPPPRLLFKLLCKLHPAMRRRIARAGETFALKRWRQDVEIWDREWKPAVARQNEALQRVDPAALSDAELAAHLEQCRDAVYRGIVLHHRLNPAAMTALGDFLVQAGEWTGLPPSRLLQMFRGAAPVSAGSADELAELAGLVRGDAELGAVLAGTDAAEAVRALAAHPVAGAAARRYLDKAGIRVATGYDVADLSVGEMPEVLVETIRAAVAQGAVAQSDAAAAATDAIRKLVPAERRAQFEELLGEALATYRMRDERAYLNDAWSTGIARRAILAAGERLVAAGRLQNAAHAFDLTHPELLSLLRGGPGPSAAEVAAHAAYRTTHTTSDAPQALGYPPAGPPPPEWLPAHGARMARAIGLVLGEMFGVRGGDSAGNAAVVTGIPASPGQVEGPARLVVAPADMAKVRAGDILVTRSTAPSYNALLPLIRGIVTDRGGTLSHAALVAREYGIPAVVGCIDATARIADGATIRVDGSAGAVQILS